MKWGGKFFKTRLPEFATFMDFLTFLPHYFLWHYSVALVDVVRTVSNYFWFLWNFFSIELLARTFFVPWKRLGETQGSLVGRAIVGTAMRGVGIVARCGVFAFAAFAFAVASITALAALALWILLPFMVGFLIVIGVRALVV